MKSPLSQEIYEEVKALQKEGLDSAQVAEKTGLPLEFVNCVFPLIAYQEFVGKGSRK